MDKYLQPLWAKADGWDWLGVVQSLSRGLVRAGRHDAIDELEDAQATHTRGGKPQTTHERNVLVKFLQELLRVSSVVLRVRGAEVMDGRCCSHDLVLYPTLDRTGLNLRTSWFSVFLSLPFPRSQEETQCKTVQRPPQCWRRTSGSDFSSVCAPGQRNSDPCCC